MSGYHYRHGGEVRYSPPAIASDLLQPEGTKFVDFADLLEVRLLDAFREYGVSWRTIRIAAEHARELLGRHHPFSSRIFKTDGRTILAELVGATGDKHLLDLVRNQWEFERIVSPLLYEGIEYNQLHEPARWWPLGENRLVLIDPARSFGAPIVVPEGVPTEVLNRAFEAEGSVEAVARWYEVNEDAVRDAIQFESQLGS
jgi:uncharacterized protein (DUF433 family)